MKITIVQAEIEEAIVNFIKSQVEVKEDQDIHIDLRATRGAEGYQADIDIRPKQAAPSNAPKASAPKADAPKAAAKPLDITDAVDNSKTKSAAAKTPKTPPAQALAQTNNSDVITADVVTADNATDTSAVDALMASQEEDPAKDEAAVASTGTVSSIFANRGKSDETAVENTDQAAQPQAAEAPVAAPKSIFAKMTTPVN